MQSKLIKITVPNNKGTNSGWIEFEVQNTVKICKKK